MTLRNPTSPSTIEKFKEIDAYAAEAVAAGTFYGASHEVPRGAEDIRFKLDATVLDETSGDEDYTFGIQGRDHSGESWAPLPGFQFAQITGSIGVDETGYEIVPSASNAPGGAVTRFVRATLLTAGTSPIATAKIWMLWRQNSMGAGKQYQSGYLGG